MTSLISFLNNSFSGSRSRRFNLSEPLVRTAAVASGPFLPVQYRLR